MNSSHQHSKSTTHDHRRTITSDDLRKYVETHYTAPRMVLAAAGGVVHEEMVELAEQYFGGLSPNHNAPSDVPKKFTGSDIRVHDVIFLAVFFLFLYLCAGPM